MERLDNSKLSPLQKHILDVISNDKIVAIVGGPGTGKTVLAMSGMDKVCGNTSSRRQILLTYSKPLSRMIDGCYDNQKTVAQTIHQFCYYFAKEIEKTSPRFLMEHKNDDRALSNIIIREYGYENTPDRWPAWNKILDRYNLLNNTQKQKVRFNDIFIDEGQDLPNEAYSFFKAISDRVIVTYDDAQEVGNDQANSNEIIRKAGIECNRILCVLGLEENFYDLIDNFRNTKQIESVAKLFYNNYGNNLFSLRAEGANREGKKPVVYNCKFDQDYIDEIVDLSYQTNKQTGIIVPDKSTFWTLKKMIESSVEDDLIPEDKFFYKYGNDDNMKEKGARLNDTGVFLTTFRNAKGMEFDDVYIFNCQRVALSTPSEKNSFYVAVTRAKENLTLVFDGNTDSPVMKIVNNNEGLFEIQK